MPYPLEVLHGSHVAWQEQSIILRVGENVLSYAKYFHCYCHATWLPCKTSILESEEEMEPLNDDANYRLSAN